MMYCEDGLSICSTTHSIPRISTFERIVPESVLMILLTHRETADNQGNANMTNLAIKGIIAIRAMAEISSVLGKHDDAQSFAVS